MRCPNSMYLSSLLKSISPQASQHPYNTAKLYTPLSMFFLFKSSHPHVLVSADAKTSDQTCHAEKTQALI